MVGNVLDYGARWYDPSIGRWNAVDPMTEVITSHSTYAYVRNNPISLYDPDGMLDNEYRTVTNEDGSTTTTKTGDEGGNETDYITTVDANGNESTKKVKVKITATDGPGNMADHQQEANPTPGTREEHKTTPLVFKALLAIFSMGGSTTASATLGFAKNVNKGRKIVKKGKASTKTSRKINAKRANAWKVKEKAARAELKNATTKKQKSEIQKRINHAVNQQKKSGNHAQKGQGS